LKQLEYYQIAKMSVYELDRLTLLVIIIYEKAVDKRGDEDQNDNAQKHQWWIVDI